MGYGTALNYGRNAGGCIMAQVAMCTSRWAKRTALPSTASMWESERVGGRSLMLFPWRNSRPHCPSSLMVDERKAAERDQSILVGREGLR
jgi:hypothetical protein